MAKRSQKTQNSQIDSQKLVTIALAEDSDQAKDYETLLKINDIPAVIKKQDEPSTNTENFAVMVPEDFLDEAHVVIESQDAYDDFYDLTSQDEDDADFDDGFLDEDL